MLRASRARCAPRTAAAAASATAMAIAISLRTRAQAGRRLVDRHEADQLAVVERIGTMSSSSSSQRSGWSGRSSRGITALGAAEVGLVDRAGRDEEGPADVEGGVEQPSRRCERGTLPAPERVDDLRRGVDGHDLEVVPRRPVQVDGDGPHVEHPGQLLDDLLQGAGQILVEGARLHLDQAAQGAQGGARLDRHDRQCPIPDPAATRGPEVLCGSDNGPEGDRSGRRSEHGPAVAGVVTAGVHARTVQMVSTPSQRMSSVAGGPDWHWPGSSPQVVVATEHLARRARGSRRRW